jgi:hypothetical protein
MKPLPPNYRAKIRKEIKDEAGLLEFCSRPLDWEKRTIVEENKKFENLLFRTIFFLAAVVVTSFLMWNIFSDFLTPLKVVISAGIFLGYATIWFIFLEE